MVQIFEVNNLAVVYLPTPGLSTARVQYHIFAGSDHEHSSKENTGYAHILEHMLFKGTKNPQGPEMGEGDVDLLGGCYGATYNAYTSRDTTSYHMDVPKGWFRYRGLRARALNK